MIEMTILDKIHYISYLNVESCSTLFTVKDHLFLYLFFKVKCTSNYYSILAIMIYNYSIAVDLSLHQSILRQLNHIIQFQCDHIMRDSNNVIY